MIGDRLAARELLGGIVDLDLDIVVGLHLPIGVAGGSAGGALLVGRGQFLVQLAELVAAVAGGVLGEARCGEERAKGEGVRTKHGRENTGLRASGCELRASGYGLRAVGCGLWAAGC